jgi:hypothetical protein
MLKKIWERKLGFTIECSGDNNVLAEGPMVS